MISVAYTIKEQLEQCILAAFEAARAAGTLPEGLAPEFTVRPPADTSRGDFSTNIAMVGAKTLKVAPMKIAQALGEQFDFTGMPVDRFEIAAPGFINFFVTQEWFTQSVSQVLAEGEHYGRSDFGQGRKVMVEFVSANPTGPMHMGNARGGAIGDCLAAALDWSGHQVTREFYLNDAGNQIEKFATSLEVRYLQIYQGEEEIPFPEDGYQGDDIRDHARAFADLHGDAYLQVESQERRKALVDYALPLNLEALRTTLEQYRITYDVWFHESTLYPEGVRDVIDLLRERGYTYEADGALWYKATAFGAEKDDVLIRANGLSTYFAADIAYHYNKFVTRGFDKVINVWGADHHGHVARLQGAMDALGIGGFKLDVVLMQLVRLMKDGKPYRMSKRSGKAITLGDLIEEIPIDAARFYFNMREPGSAFDFDLDLAVNESAKNPVYYVQYAHARICSILKNLRAEGITPREVTESELNLLVTPEERELIRQLGQLPEEIITAARQYDPARLTHYVSEVATLFHKFYNVCRVKGEPEPLLQARLALCIATRTVLANGLGLLKISAPQVM